MKIIGIDPGYATIGYGVLDYRNTRFTTLDYGAIITTPDHPFPERLKIYEETSAIIERHRPDAAAHRKALPITRQQVSMLHRQEV